jgi:hypothetical protein
VLTFSPKETLNWLSQEAIYGRGRVKRALFLFNMASSQKGAVFFMSPNEIAIEAPKCSVMFPRN